MKYIYIVWIVFAAAVFVFLSALLQIYSAKNAVKNYGNNTVNIQQEPKELKLDRKAYENKLYALANVPVSATTTTSTVSALWPADIVYPNAGAILPFKRVVAYYGNLYSRGMGILGEYSADEVLRRLLAEKEKWESADPGTPVKPALHYIAVVAQAGPRTEGKYIARMPDGEIDKVLAMAEKINAIVFLDLQIGLSNLETEMPLLEKYWKLPNVHMGIDPEFAMKNGDPPGTVIGTLDASKINFVADYLAEVVRENDLPPKILVIHRFTQAMVANYQNIQPLPEVQVVVNMDGFGAQPNKLNTYREFIYKEPVQFTGFKIFYKNDSKYSTILEPEDLLKLQPIPIYIQYQ